jgi:hypothetical protein
MHVKCGVENCQYNKEHMCHANTIEVNVMGDSDVESCHGTCCVTFKK